MKRDLLINLLDFTIKMLLQFRSGALLFFMSAFLEGIMLKRFIFTMLSLICFFLTQANGDTGKYTKITDNNLIPMQRIIYPDLILIQKQNIGPEFSRPQVNIESTNINPKELSETVASVKKSICGVIQSGKVRFWVEASGKAEGVIISGTIGGGIEVTINCGSEKS